MHLVGINSLARDYSSLSCQPLLKGIHKTMAKGLTWQSITTRPPHPFTIGRGKKCRILAFHSTPFVSLLEKRPRFFPRAAKAVKLEFNDLSSSDCEKPRIGLEKEE